MKVMFDNVLYDVTWSYSDKKNNVNHLIKQTKCAISTIDMSKYGAARFTAVAIGVANQHFNDPFVKETGRKISLARALNEFTKNMLNAKFVRSIFWNAYFNRHRTGKANN